MKTLPVLAVICIPVNSTPIEITTDPTVVVALTCVTKISLSICTDTVSVVEVNKLVVGKALALAVTTSSPKKISNSTDCGLTIASAFTITVLTVDCNKLVLKLTLASATTASSPKLIVNKLVDKVTLASAFIVTVLTVDVIPFSSTAR